MWKLKSKIMPKKSNDKIAKKDELGNLVSSPKLLKKMYLKTYLDRLSPNNINPTLKFLQETKETLFDERINLAKLNKTGPISQVKVDKVLSKVKNNKSRDPLGHINEIFKSGIGGSDIKVSITKMINKMKDEISVPDLIQIADITCIYVAVN